MSPLLKNILIAFVLALIVFLGYVLFIRQGEDEPLATGGSRGVSTEVTVETQQFLIRLQELQQINFDRPIFSDDRFRSLVNFRQDIEDEPTGRENPFEPVQ